MLDLGVIRPSEITVSFLLKHIHTAGTNTIVTYCRFLEGELGAAVRTRHLAFDAVPVKVVLVATRRDTLSTHAADQLEFTLVLMTLPNTKHSSEVYPSSQICLDLFILMS